MSPIATSRRFLCAALLAGAAFASAQAAPRPLGTDEIRMLLTGNTVHGTWAGREYYSFFDANGWTSYIEPGKPAELGRWRVHDNKYCSKWGEFAESCFALELDGETLIWITSDQNRYPSKVLPGDQFPK